MIVYHFPYEYRINGIPEPSIYCKDQTEKIIYTLKTDYKIKPEKIEPIKSGGLKVTYFNCDNYNSWGIIIFNSMSIFSIIYNIKDDTFVLAEDIFQLNFENSLSKFFK